MRGPGRATVSVPGSCGELVQGTREGVPFLVSCPIDRYSTATVNVLPGGGVRGPAGAIKALAALRAALRWFGRDDLGVELRLASALPPGKGMASSTADVAATIWAAATALGEEIHPAEVAQLAVAIEPTDSVIFPGLACFDHRVGSFIRPLGPAPAADLIVLDFGGEVDTVAFNAVDHSAVRRKLEPLTAEALALVERGIERRDLWLIGEATTLSARANQAILPKPGLEPAIAFAAEAGGFGVVAAHSGTVLGLLFEAGRPDLARLAELAQQQIPGVEATWCCCLVDGGVRVRAPVAAGSTP